MEEHGTPNNNGETSINTTQNLQNPNNGEIITPNDLHTFSEDIDSACSTPYVSAPSSPGRGSPLQEGGGGGGFFYSAPASPMHYVLSNSSVNSMSTRTETTPSVSSSFEFEFSGRYVADGSSSALSMSSADELFLNGQIRPMKLSTHLQRPQMLAPLLDLKETDGGDCDDEDKLVRGRDLKLQYRSLRRRARSMSPLRSSSLQWNEDGEIENETNQDGEIEQNEAVPSETPPSGSSSRSSSVGRSSKRWVFLKEFLYRSKSEGQGRNNGHKFWSSLSFSPVKDKKMATTTPTTVSSDSISSKEKATAMGTAEEAQKKVKPRRKKAAAANGVGKRRVPLSAHEMHYTANRAQAEEMKKKTFLPYRQGLLGCLGFSSKSYGAINGFARALNPVSSR